MRVMRGAEGDDTQKLKLDKSSIIKTQNYARIFESARSSPRDYIEHESESATGYITESSGFFFVVSSLSEDTTKKKRSLRSL